MAVVTWPTAASGAAFELTWSAPEECPSREEIVDATYAHLGESRSEGPPELLVQGTVSAADDGFVVTLVLEDTARRRSMGERIVRVDQHECREILTPASVVLAMMIAVARPRVAQPDERGEPAEGPPPGQASPARAPRPPAARRTEVTPPEPPPPHRLSVGAAGMASTGFLPRLGLGAGIHASYWPRSPLLFRLDASFEDGGSTHAAGGNVGFQLVSAAVRAGLSAARTKDFELIPTVGGRAGVIHHSAVGFAAAQDESRVVGSVGPGVLARAKLGPSVVLEGLLDTELILRRDRFHVLQGDTRHFIHEPSPVAVRFALGLAYDFR